MYRCRDTYYEWRYMADKVFRYFLSFSFDTAAWQFLLLVEEIFVKCGPYSHTE